METNAFKAARTKYNQHGFQSVETVAKETGIQKTMIDDLESTVGKKRGVSYLRVAELAKYYGVSSDYLLGLTDNPSIDPDVKMIGKYTGLSTRGIKWLAQAKQLYNGDFISFLSNMMEKVPFQLFMYYLYDYKLALEAKRISDNELDKIASSKGVKFENEDLADENVSAVFDEHYHFLSQKASDESLPSGVQECMRLMCKLYYPDEESDLPEILDSTMFDFTDIYRSRVDKFYNHVLSLQEK